MPICLLDSSGLAFEITAPRIHPIRGDVFRRGIQHAKEQFTSNEEAAAWLAELLAELGTPALDSIEEVQWIRANAPETRVSVRESARFRGSWCVFDAQFTDRDRALQFKLTF